MFHELDYFSFSIGQHLPPLTVTFHGLRTFGSHGGSHGGHHTHLYSVEVPHTPHHWQKTLRGAPITPTAEL